MLPLIICVEFDGALQSLTGELNLKLLSVLFNLSKDSRCQFYLIAKSGLGTRLSTDPMSPEQQSEVAYNALEKHLDKTLFSFDDFQRFYEYFSVDKNTRARAVDLVMNDSMHITPPHFNEQQVQAWNYKKDVIQADFKDFDCFVKQLFLNAFDYSTELFHPFQCDHNESHQRQLLESHFSEYGLYVACIFSYIKSLHNAFDSDDKRINFRPNAQDFLDRMVLIHSSKTILQHSCHSFSVNGPNFNARSMWAKIHSIGKKNKNKSVQDDEDSFSKKYISYRVYPESDEEQKRRYILKSLICIQGEGSYEFAYSKSLQSRMDLLKLMALSPHGETLSLLEWRQLLYFELLSTTWIEFSQLYHLRLQDEINRFDELYLLPENVEPWRPEVVFMSLFRA